MHKLLLLEDEIEIGQNLKEILLDEGYQVDWFVTGDEIVSAAISQNYDLMILDVMLKNPAGRSSGIRRISNGLEVARIVNQHKKTPYILLTSRNEPFEIMQGLDAGAEDYITKPYDLTELLARIRRIIRRIDEANKDEVSSVLTCGDIVLNTIDHKVHLSDQQIHLAPQLYELLRFFLKNKGHILSKEELYNGVWGYNPAKGTETNTLEVNIKRLRQVIGTKYITTVRGQGYVLEEH